MALGTPVVTLHSSDGARIPRFLDYHAQNSLEMSRVHGTPQASGYVTTSASESGAVIDLTDEGFEFLADNEYEVTLVGRHSNDANKWRQAWSQRLLGGTTPVLRGSPKLLSAEGQISATQVAYGRCRLVANIATLVVTEVTAGEQRTSEGTSMADFSTGAVLTHPIARAGKRVTSAHFSADVATIGERRSVQVVPNTSSTTMTVTTANMDATSAVADPEGDGFLDIEFEILPPPRVFLAMDSNNVQVHVGYDASDLVQHYVDVYVSRSEHLPFGA